MTSDPQTLVEDTRRQASILCDSRDLKQEEAVREAV